MPKLLPHSGKKGSLLCPLLPEQNRLISVPLPAYLPQGGIWSFEVNGSRSCRMRHDRDYAASNVAFALKEPALMRHNFGV
jgi:hypothetical protein